MADLIEINDLDGFDFFVEVFVEKWSKEIEIVDLYDLDYNLFDNDEYEFFINNYYDEILELCIQEYSRIEGDY